VIRISSFNHTTAQQLADQLADARQHLGAAMKGVVLDLRGNPGGLLDQSVAVADLFLTGGIIVTTHGRHPASQQYFRAAPDDVIDGLPLAVLVNGGSASASEIVAAALQDDRRAVVVGSSSYGKGTVQTVLRLPNDGELTLTWAKLVTPTGYILHEHGVVPTVCTAGMGDSEAEIARTLRRATIAAAPATPAGRRRIDLDEAGWGALRKACPTETTDRPVELKVAERLISDRALYARALHPEPENVAATRPLE
jgi:carboxyl-terminal processing protease